MHHKAFTVDPLHRLAAAQFPTDHFTHVFLDEVGHAMEPEAIVAIAGILPSSGRLILAGDPHQLGPMVRSIQATSGGLIFPKTGLGSMISFIIYSINYNCFKL